MASQPEGKITDRCIKYLRSLPTGHARKVHQSRFTGGEPDVDGCVDGRTVKVEVKVPGNKPTPRQLAVMRQWERAGALVGWVTSVDELRDLLVHLNRRDWRNPQLAPP